VARFGEVLKGDPENIEACVILGLIYNHRQEYEKAYVHLKKAVALDPDNVRCWHALGGCLYNLNHFEASVIAFQEAVSREPSNPDQFLCLARALSACERSDEALATINKALELAPGYSEAYCQLGREHQARGEFDEARKNYHLVLEGDPTNTVAYHNLSKLKNSPDEARALLDRMEPLSTDTALDRNRRMALLFAMADMRGQLKYYDEAFAAYAEANGLLKYSTPDHWAEFNTQISETIEGFTADVFEQLKDAASDDETPIFIVGMPRSGTTLVEQIVSSHPDVYAMGELPRLQKIVSIFLGAREGKIRYPRDVRDISADAFLSLAEDYLSHLRRTAPETCRRITDKLPFNYLNLGLIAVMFPKATIIHCRRDPMDTCLSCYFQNFNKVGNLWFTNDLEDLGRYYRNYDKLMAHWRRVLPLPIFDVQYEDLISDQETVSRRIIAHAGLEWDDSCLDFHKNKRAVTTASVWQVRQPVYKTSMHRWKRYERHLEPLKKALAEQQTG
jgi:tetratricopeptide (TPR) repeat protein